MTLVQYRTCLRQIIRDLLVFKKTEIFTNNRMEQEQANLSVLDFSRATTDRFGLATDLVEALHDVGFLVLENVPGTDPSTLHRACEWLFSLPKELKMNIMRKRWNPINSNVYRGFFPADSTNSSYKEAFELGLELPAADPDIVAGNVFYEDPPWPREDGTFKFKTIARDYFNKMQSTSVEIMRLIALGLGENENVFDKMFCSKPLSTLRFLHYPPREGKIPDTAIEDGKVVVCGVHTDSTILTLLQTFHYAGLEVLCENGAWLAVKPQPGTLVVNIGDMLAQFTGGRLKATQHRVVDLGKNRYSVPFFLEPNYHADISKPPISQQSGAFAKYMPQGVSKDGSPCKYGHWLSQTVKKKKYIEYDGVDFPEL